MSSDEEVKEENGSSTEKVKEKSAGSTDKKSMTDMFGTIKSMNPKVLFGIAGVALIALFFLMAGGNSGEMKIVSKSLQIGQVYKLLNPNAASDISDTSIVTAPGNLEVYDRSKKDGSVVCAAPKDTPVKIIEFADAFGKKDLFAHVEVIDGGCKGKKGWVMISNIKD